MGSLADLNLPKSESGRWLVFFVLYCELFKDEEIYQCDVQQKSAKYLRFDGLCHVFAMFLPCFLPC